MPSKKILNWEPILKEFEQSGLTCLRFCKEKNLKYSTFSAWKNKLRPKAPNTAPENPFVSVKIKASQLSAKKDHFFELSLFGQVQIKSSQLPDPQWVADLVLAVQIKGQQS